MAPLLRRATDNGAVATRLRKGDGSGGALDAGDVVSEHVGLEGEADAGVRSAALMTHRHSGLRSSSRVPAKKRRSNDPGEDVGAGPGSDRPPQVVDEFVRYRRAGDGVDDRFDDEFVDGSGAFAGRS